MNLRDDYGCFFKKMKKTRDVGYIIYIKTNNFNFHLNNNSNLNLRIKYKPENIFLNIFNDITL